MSLELMGRKQAWNGDVSGDSPGGRTTGTPDNTWWPGHKMMGQESSVERETFSASWAGPPK